MKSINRAGLAALITLTMATSMTQAKTNIDLSRFPKSVVDFIKKNDLSTQLTKVSGSKELTTEIERMQAKYGRHNDIRLENIDLYMQSPIYQETKLGGILSKLKVSGSNRPEDIVSELQSTRPVLYSERLFANSNKDPAEGAPELTEDQIREIFLGQDRNTQWADWIKEMTDRLDAASNECSAFKHKGKVYFFAAYPDRIEFYERVEGGLQKIGYNTIIRAMQA